MARCYDCGQEAWPRSRRCTACHTKRRERRLTAYQQAVEEFGPITTRNQAQFKKRVLALEKLAAAAAAAEGAE